ncbi:MAG: meso-butanediol dehydrogenase/(S,S)-butanediol dehydrogenase/diacetyl reductase [Halieaceae bacterium]|jgi:meso-butanediol dehydrogenase/(S,S)-butanediol dehydrogenase/diacetyl reductase
MQELESKVAIITGAGQGVGQGIAYGLCDLGATVVAAGRTLAKVENTVAEVVRRGGQGLAVECDVNDLASLQNCVAKTIEKFGGINILVNNAQEVPLGALNDVTDEAFTRGFTSGPLATHRMMKLCYPYLKGDGNIINLASTAGRRADIANFGAYGAVKEAIRVLTRAAACEWGQDNIRTNVILPHATSPGLKWWVNEFPDEAAAFVAGIPMKRIGDCEEDIGRAVARMCTADFAYLNGQSIALDGGQGLIG